MSRVAARETVTVAMTGASGALYGLRLLEQLLTSGQMVYLLISKAAQVVLATETELRVPAQPEQAQAYLVQHFGCAPEQLQVFGREQWMAPVASGSAAPKAMVVCPCSTGTLSAIANGASDNLIERAADVVIKEQRKLILVVRETPLSAIHLENMLKLARLGVVILPASPGFYHQPESIMDLVDHITARVLDHLGLEHSLSMPWGYTQE
ncbi:MAG: UbiX family flavin prenyltransferase [Gammaproteobacteria bacterium]|nr:UbiX family flavin prenyltransferase [Gammaproteobacteria bacterium]